MAAADPHRVPDPLTALNHASLRDAGGWVDRLHGIRVPVQPVHGRKDRVLPHVLERHAAEA
jgi:hypothetical protein